MKKILFLLALLFPIAAHAQTAAYSGFCDQGATSAVTSGLSSTNKLQGIIPYCTVEVFLTGTLTHATIYKDAINTPQTNPYRTTVNGQITFYAATGVGYDIVKSGGIPPLVYTTPITVTDWEAGGGGGATWNSVTGGSQTGSGTSQLNTFPGSTSAQGATLSRVPILPTSGDTVDARNMAVTDGPGSYLTVLDDFQRPDTAPGTVGTMNTGQTWDVRTRGLWPQPNGGFANAGQILSNSYSTPNAWSYILATSAESVNRIGMDCTYQANTGSDESGECVMAILFRYPNQVYPNVNNTCITAHIEVTDIALGIGYYNCDGIFQPIGYGSWSPLTIGQKYRAEAVIVGNDIYFNLTTPDALGNQVPVPNGSYRFTNSFLSANPSPYVFFEETNGPTSLVTATMQQVWAGVYGGGPPMAGDVSGTTQNSVVTGANGAQIVSNAPIAATNNYGQIIDARTVTYENWYINSNNLIWNTAPFSGHVSGSPSPSPLTITASGATGPYGETGDVWRIQSALNGDVTPVTGIGWLEQLAVPPNTLETMSVWLKSNSGTCSLNWEDWAINVSVPVTVTSSWTEFTLNNVRSSSSGLTSPGFYIEGGVNSDTCDILFAQPQVSFYGGAFIATTTSSIVLYAPFPIPGGINLPGAASPMELSGSAGTTGQVLTSQGPGATPVWGTGGGGSGTVGSGTEGQFAYYPASGTTVGGKYLQGTDLPSSVVQTTQANSYTAGEKQTFQASSTTAGFSWGGVTADPSSPSNGDEDYRTDLTRAGLYTGSAWHRFAFTDDTTAIANGGTGQTSAANALIALLPTASEVGDMIYCASYSSGCTSWALLNGNTSGTKWLQQTSAGVPSWTTPTAGAAGSNYQVQYNNGGALGAITDVTSDGTNMTIKSGGSLTIASGGTLTCAAGATCAAGGSGTVGSGIQGQMAGYGATGTTVGGQTIAPFIAPSLGSNSLPPTSHYQPIVPTSSPSALGVYLPLPQTANFASCSGVSNAATGIVATTQASPGVCTLQLPAAIDVTKPFYVAINTTATDLYGVHVALSNPLNGGAVIDWTLNSNNSSAATSIGYSGGTYNANMSYGASTGAPAGTAMTFFADSDGQGLWAGWIPAQPLTIQSGTTGLYGAPYSADPSWLEASSTYVDPSYGPVFIGMSTLTITTWSTANPVTGIYIVQGSLAVPADGKMLMPMYLNPCTGLYGGSSAFGAPAGPNIGYAACNQIWVPGTYNSANPTGIWMDEHPNGFYNVEPSAYPALAALWANGFIVVHPNTSTPNMISANYVNGLMSGWGAPSALLLRKQAVDWVRTNLQNSWGLNHYGQSMGCITALNYERTFPGGQSIFCNSGVTGLQTSWNQTTGGTPFQSPIAQGYANWYTALQGGTGQNPVSATTYWNLHAASPQAISQTLLSPNTQYKDYWQAGTTYTTGQFVNVPLATGTWPTALNAFDPTQTPWSYPSIPIYLTGCTSTWASPTGYDGAIYANAQATAFTAAVGANVTQSFLSDNYSGSGTATITAFSIQGTAPNQTVTFSTTTPFANGTVFTIPRIGTTGYMAVATMLDNRTFTVTSNVAGTSMTANLNFTWAVNVATTADTGTATAVSCQHISQDTYQLTIPALLAFATAHNPVNPAASFGSVATIPSPSTVVYPSTAQTPQSFILTSPLTSSSATNVPGFTWTIGANQRFTVQCDVFYQSSYAGSSLQLQLSGPALGSSGAKGYTSAEGWVTGLTGTPTVFTDKSVAWANSYALFTGGGAIAASGTQYTGHVVFSVQNGVTAGTLQLQASGYGGYNLQLNSGSTCVGSPAN